MAWETRQLLRQTDSGVIAPKPEQPDQALARARRILAQRCEFGGRLRVKHLLAGLVELVERARLPQLFGKLGRGFGGGLRVGKQSDEFVGRDRAVVGPSDLGCEPQRLLGGAQLCLLESLTGDFRSKWQRGQSEDVADHLPLDLESAVAGNPRNREGRIGRQAFSDEVGFGQRQFVVGRLQAPIVQERDLDGGVDGQAPAEQTLHRGVGALRVVFRADRDDFLPDRLIGDGGNHPHAAIRRERRASGKEEGGKERRARCVPESSPPRRAVRCGHAAHRSPPCPDLGAGAARSFCSRHDNGCAGRRLV